MRRVNLLSFGRVRRLTVTFENGDGSKTHYSGVVEWSEIPEIVQARGGQAKLRPIGPFRKHRTRAPR